MYQEVRRPVRTAPTLSLFLKRLKNCTLRTDANVQRLEDQWNTENIANLIETVLTNDFIAPLVLGDVIMDDKGNIDSFILDGLQRSTTLFKFRYGNIKITKDIDIPYKKLVVDENGNRKTEWAVFNLKNKRYDNLPEELQDMFESYQIDVVTYENITMETADMLVRRLNMCKSMTTSQKAFTYQGDIACDIREIINETFFFADCGKYSPTAIKNGTVERIVTESYMTVYDRENYKKNAIKLAEYANDTATKKNLDELKEIYSELYTVCVGKFENYFNQKNTSIFVAAYYECKKMGHNANDFAKFLDAMEKGLDKTVINGENWEEVNSNRNTKDKQTILNKINYLVELMKRYFSGETTEIIKIETANTEESSVSETVGLAYDVVDRVMAS